jgi:hypothetical protein
LSAGRAPRDEGTDSTRRWWWLSSEEGAFEERAEIDVLAKGSGEGVGIGIGAVAEVAEGLPPREGKDLCRVGGVVGSFRGRGVDEDEACHRDAAALELCDGEGGLVDRAQAIGRDQQNWHSKKMSERRGGEVGPVRCEQTAGGLDENRVAELRRGGSCIPDRLG